MFHVVDTLLLQPSPRVGEPAGLRNVLVERQNELTDKHELTDALAYPAVRDLEQVSGVAGVAAYARRESVLGRGEEARPVEVARVTGDYFQVLQVPTRLGRPLSMADDEEAAPLTAVISSGLWQRLFGGRHDVIGSTIELDGNTYQVVGVAPAGFAGSDRRRTDVWVPLLAGAHASFWKDNRLFHHLRAIVRLEPEASERRIETEATTVHAAAYRELPAAGRYDVDAQVRLEGLAPGAGALAGQEERLAPWLLGVSMLVLLLACAGVAHLLLVRATLSRGELGVRMALGSSQQRLWAESVLEGALPALMAAAIAVPMGLVSGPFLGRLLVPDLGWDSVGGRSRYLAFLVLTGVGAGVVAALLPAVRTSRVDAARVLGSASDRIRGVTPWLSTIQVVQVSIATLLLVCAGLFVQSLREVRRTDLGLAVEEVLLARPAFHVSAAERVGYFDEAEATLARLPNVKAVAAAAMTTPFGGQVFLGVTGGGTSGVENPRAFITLASPGYLEATGILLLHGRTITAADREGSEPVAGDKPNHGPYALAGSRPDGPMLPA